MAIPPEQLKFRDGQSIYRDVKTTLTDDAHLINTDDHAGNMAALGALGTGPTPSYGENLVPLRRLTCLRRPGVGGLTESHLNVPA